MVGSVGGEFAAAGNSERGHQAEALLGDLAGEVQLMTPLLVGRASCQLGRRRREDVPASRRIDGFEFQHVAAELPHAPVQLRLVVDEQQLGWNAGPWTFDIPGPTRPFGGQAG